MRLAGHALRLTIFLDADETWHHKPLYHEIVHRAHKAGATVLRGIEGFGASSLIHTTRILSLADDLPAVIIIVDSTERVREFLPQIEDLIDEGMIILDDVEVIRYVGKNHGG